MKNKKMCVFPECRRILSTYHEHHITPKEIFNTSKNKKTIPLCPTCHSLIYHPMSKFGNHSIKADESIEIISHVLSTAGMVLCYKKCNEGKEYMYFIKSGEIIEA